MVFSLLSGSKDTCQYLLLRSMVENCAAKEYFKDLTDVGIGRG